MAFKDRIRAWLDIPQEWSGDYAGLPLLDLSANPSIIYPRGDFGALYSIAYLACEQTKARSLGSLPVAVYRKDGGKRIEVSHPLEGLLSGQANDLMSGRDLRHWLSLRRDTFGNAYMFVEWWRGFPVAIWPITQHVEISYDKDARPGRRVRYVIHEGSDFVPAGVYFSDEVINIRTTVTKDGVFGQSLAELSARDVGLSIDLEAFYASLLANGNHHLGHVELPAGRMTPDDLASLQRAIEAKRGISGAGKTPIFGYGAKWVQDGSTIADMNLIDQQAWVLEQVCRACNVPPWMIYDSRNGGGKYENAEASRVDYVTNTMVPDVASLETALNVILRANGARDLYIKFDLNGLMRGDKAAQGQWYREMVYAGIMTRDEVRALEDLNPREHLDSPLIPLNYGVLQPDGSVQLLASGSVAEPADGMQTGTTD